MSKKVVNLIVEAGKATPAPPLGPALAPFGLNLGQVVKEINEKTKEFEGMKVPIKVIVDLKTKKFEIEVGSPPTSELLKREAGVEKGSGMASKQPVGNISFDQLLKVTKIKLKDMRAKSLKAAVKEVIGACISMGITIDNKNGKEILREIEEGKYDEFFK